MKVNSGSPHLRSRSNSNASATRGGGASPEHPSLSRGGRSNNYSSTNAMKTKAARQQQQQLHRSMRSDSDGSVNTNNGNTVGNKSRSSSNYRGAAAQRRARRRGEGNSTVDNTNNNTTTGGNMNVNDTDLALGKKKSRFGRVRVPLAAIFALQSLILVVAVITIIVVNNVTSTDATRTQIRQSVSASLAHARGAIKAPIDRFELYLNEMRSSYISGRLIDGSDPCSDHGNHFSNSSRLLAEYDGALTEYPEMVYLFSVRRSRNNLINGDSLNGQWVICGVTGNGIHVIQNGTNKFSTRRLVNADYTKFNQIPFVVRDESDSRLQYEYESAIETMKVTQQSWRAGVSTDRRTGKPIFTLVGYVPSTVMKANRTNARSYITYNPLATDLLNNVRDPRFSYSVVAASFGTAVDMTSFNTLMREVTDLHDSSDPDAHTSLYDLGTSDGVPTLLATSDTSFAPFTTSNTLWTAGETPSNSLNDAFRAAKTEDFMAIVQAEEDRTWATTASTASLSDFVENDETGQFMKILDEKDEVNGKKSIIATTLITSRYGIRFALVQSVPRKLYYGSSDDARTVSIVIGVVAAVLVIVSCVCIAYAIFSSLNKISANMELAAALKNERVVPTSSVVSELYAVCHAFDQMNERLAIAKMYLPQHLLVSTSSSSDSDADNQQQHAVNMRNGGDASEGGDNGTAGGSDNRSHVSSARGAGINGRGGVKEIANDVTTRSLTSTMFIGDSDYTTTAGDHGTARVAINTNTITIKRVTVLSINVRSFYQTVNFSIPTTVITPTAAFTETISAIANKYKGVIDAFHGDHYVVTFNAARHNADGAMSAARTATEVIDSFNVNSDGSSSSDEDEGDDVYNVNRYEDDLDLLEKSKARAAKMESKQQQRGNGKHNNNTNNNSNSNNNNNGTSTARTVFSMGLATGRAAVGNMGCTTLKRLSIVGPVYSKAMALERMCRRIQDVHSIATAAANAAVAASADATYNFNENTMNIAAMKHSTASDALMFTRCHAGSDTVECLTEGLFATEIQHACTLQVVGAVPANINTFLKVDTTAVANNAAASAAAMVLSATASSAANQQQQNAVYTVELPIVKQLPPGKVLYCIRGVNMNMATAAANAQTHNNKKTHKNSNKKKSNNHTSNNNVVGTTHGDEWLYELTNNGAGASPLTQHVNAALTTYLSTATFVKSSPQYNSTPAIMMRQMATGAGQSVFAAPTSSGNTNNGAITTAADATGLAYVNLLKTAQRTLSKTLTEISANGELKANERSNNTNNNNNNNNNHVTNVTYNDEGGSDKPNGYFTSEAASNSTAAIPLPPMPSPSLEHYDAFGAVALRSARKILFMDTTTSVHSTNHHSSFYSYSSSCVSAVSGPDEIAVLSGIVSAL